MTANHRNMVLALTKESFAKLKDAGKLSGLSECLRTVRPKPWRWDIDERMWLVYTETVPLVTTWLWTCSDMYGIYLEWDWSPLDRSPPLHIVRFNVTGHQGKVVGILIQLRRPTDKTNFRYPVHTFAYVYRNKFGTYMHFNREAQRQQQLALEACLERGLAIQSVYTIG